MIKNNCCNSLINKQATWSSLQMQKKKTKQTQKIIMNLFSDIYSWFKNITVWIEKNLSNLFGMSIKTKHHT